jgi:lipopolysaccharide transport system permease protein
VLQPVLTVLVFTVLFGYIANFKDDRFPYGVVVFAGLLPWQFFSNALTESSQSLIASERLITKVYFPRLIIPASSVMTGAVDFAIGLALLFLLMAGYGVSFSIYLLLLPFFFLVSFVAAFAVGLWFCALNVQYRDVKYIVPFLARIGMYVSPVAFVSEKVTAKLPGSWSFLYNLNPMVGVIDGFRWCVFGPAFEPVWPAFWISVGMILVLLVGGAYYFRSMERNFADII